MIAYQQTVRIDSADDVTHVQIEKIEPSLATNHSAGIQLSLKTFGISMHIITKSVCQRDFTMSKKNRT